MGEPYHKFVFNTEERKFIGDFEKMYKAEVRDGFDSWGQDNAKELDKQIVLKIIEKYNFQSLLDIGCGKGYLTSLVKNQIDVVFGLDISQEAISIAQNRYNDINFFKADINHDNWTQSFKDIKKNTIAPEENNIDCIMCLELLSYIKNWKRAIKEFSEFGNFCILKLYLPKNPIGYVKNNEELLNAFKKHYILVEYIQLVNKNITILFGKRNKE